MQPNRRSYSKSFKVQVIQECAQPGASIASVALSHSINANIVHKWIRLQSQASVAVQPAFIPLARKRLPKAPCPSRSIQRSGTRWSDLHEQLFLEPLQ